MKLIVQPLKLIEILAFAWTGIKLFIDEFRRYYYREEIVVKTKSGHVKGFKIASNFDYSYFNFIGIPYAKPPVGELRFKDPQPFEPSSEIINQEFSRRGSMACQADLLTHLPIGKENCVHLSVFTRDINPKKLKPTMVWIHGGAFIFGSNSKDFYNPEFLLRKDIILICINYRLGAFGFLSLKDPKLGVPGNAGLKDQVMALKWVKENCMHFGGDPNNITVFGQSAGAASVSMHMLSERSKNLFHKAIMMSGNAYARWALATDNDRPQRLAKKLGWNGKGGESACLAVLRNASPHVIIKMQEEITTLEDRKQYTSIPFAPVIEAYESEQCFLNQHPTNLISSAWSKHVPAIVGACSNDGYVFFKMTKKEPQIAHQDNLKSLLSFVELDTDIESEQCRKLAEQLKYFYFDHLKSNIQPQLTHFTILHDKGFAFPTHQMITHRNTYQHAPTYLLRFDFDSPYSLSKRVFVGQKLPGACHGDDCSYYFRTASSGPDPANDTDEWRTIERVCEIFSTFASIGEPNNKSIAPFHWQPVVNQTADQTSYKYKCLNVSKEVSYIDWPDLERMQFWDKIYDELSQS